MLSIRLLFISLIALSFVTPVVAQGIKPESRESLETIVPEGIRLLEAKEHKVFVEVFVPPTDLKKITEGTSMEEFVKMFGDRKAARLLDVLKDIKGTKPSLEDNGTKATFTLNQEIGGKKSIAFVKVEKYWYIKN